MILNNFEINANFWNLNPQLMIPEEFAILYNNDKSKKKEESSKLMWAVALFIDSDSKFYNLSPKDRQDIIAKDYLKNTKFNWKTLDKQIALYEKLNISPAQRQLNEWSRLMDEKSTYIRTLKYKADTADEIEKRLLTNGKLFDELNRLKEMLQKDGPEGKVKGNAVEAFFEKDENK